MELHEQIETIDSREDLAAFIDRLRDDLRESPEDWENPELDRYLDALGAWTAAMDGYFQNRGEPVPQTPSWRLIATMLLAAKMYE